MNNIENVNTLYIEKVADFFKQPLTLMMQKSPVYKGHDGNYYAITTMNGKFDTDFSKMAFAVWKYNNVNKLNVKSIRYFPTKKMSLDFISNVIS